MMGLAENNFSSITEGFDPKRKKDFAREQVQFLREKGITNAEQISRIFKIAGPGQIQEAWKLADCVRDKVAKGEVSLDVFDCVIVGMGGSQDFGWERMVKVIGSLGFYVPQVHSEYCFFRALDAALEILIPGSYEFTPEELLEISEGLQRRYSGGFVKSSNYS